MGRTKSFHCSNVHFFSSFRSPWKTIFWEVLAFILSSPLSQFLRYDSQPVCLPKCGNNMNQNTVRQVDFRIRCYEYWRYCVVIIFHQDSGIKTRMLWRSLQVSFSLRQTESQLALHLRGRSVRAFRQWRREGSNRTESYIYKDALKREKKYWDRGNLKCHNNNKKRRLEFVFSNIQYKNNLNTSLCDRVTLRFRDGSAI